MSRYLIPISVFLLIPDCAQSQQLKLYIPGFSDSCGRAVRVPVKAVDFDNLLSLQFTLGWDTAKLSFTGISGFGPANLFLGPGNFGTNNAANGYMTFLWNDGNLSGESLPDSSTIFTLSFLSRNNVSTTGSVELRSSPTPIEAIDVSLSTVPVAVNNGAYTIFCTTCDTSYWLGSLSDAWDVAGNWSCARVPDASTVVIVNPSNSFSPVVRTPAACRKIFVNRGSSINVAPGAKLEILGIE